MFLPTCRRFAGGGMFHQQMNRFWRNVPSTETPASARNENASRATPPHPFRLHPFRSLKSHTATPLQKYEESRHHAAVWYRHPEQDKKILTHRSAGWRVPPAGGFRAYGLSRARGLGSLSGMELTDWVLTYSSWIAFSSGVTELSMKVPEPMRRCETAGFSSSISDTARPWRVQGLGLRVRDLGFSSGTSDTARGVWRQAGRNLGQVEQRVKWFRLVGRNLGRKQDWVAWSRVSVCGLYLDTEAADKGSLQVERSRLPLVHLRVVQMLGTSGTRCCVPVERTCVGLFNLGVIPHVLPPSRACPASDFLAAGQCCYSSRLGSGGWV